jgi:hypothetical protein
MTTEGPGEATGTWVEFNMVLFATRLKVVVAVGVDVIVVVVVAVAVAVVVNVVVVLLVVVAVAIGGLVFMVFTGSTKVDHGHNAADR